MSESSRFCLAEFQRSVTGLPARDVFDQHEALIEQKATGEKNQIGQIALRCSGECPTAILLYEDKITENTASHPQINLQACLNRSA